MGLPKWEFSTGKKHFTPGKNSGKMTLPPLRNCPLTPLGHPVCMFSICSIYYLHHKIWLHLDRLISAILHLKEKIIGASILNLFCVKWLLKPFYMFWYFDNLLDFISSKMILCLPSFFFRSGIPWSYAREKL